MKIPTTRFGTLDLDESTFIHFPWGIPGFEEVKRYVLLEHRQGPFKWLQAVDHPDVAFVVSPPHVFGIRYKVPEKRVAPLDVQEPQDLAILVLVSFDRKTRAVRPHVRAPLLLNAANRRAYQWVMERAEIGSAMESVEPTAPGDGEA
ncbi:flagellar assembly factor FliW [Desulfacinum hydrothermale DSM 13146]|uniref:Flagellar assembly factor FliW n=1 Tax=Desulfacinum hydrothermale DSM 13146 TaxID=1121390 RepID=A0A1W1XF41_9BACT|nr:flagellar assembly protein FliW [Desulfacinum hydrothermale]SMC22432.1 flagellar assembly factor FliW [Desulfacinum hydrothermale DSM 13146]